MKAMAALAVLGLAAPAAAQEAALPEWMAGCWSTAADEDGSGAWADECWMSPRGGVMLGAGRSGTGEGLESWEAMQLTIEPAEARRDSAPRLTFWASPNGAGRTGFALAPSDLPGVTFVNLANDYPQRVRYWRDGELLRAEISMADGSEAQSWTFVPVGSE